MKTLKITEETHYLMTELKAKMRIKSYDLLILKAINELALSEGIKLHDKSKK